LRGGEPWALDVYLRPPALRILVDQAATAAAAKIVFTATIDPTGTTVLLIRA